jgi:hypothetical protein
MVLQGSVTSLQQKSQLHDPSQVYLLHQIIVKTFPHGNLTFTGKVAHIRARELREAMETALCERKPLAVIVVEAHHLAEAARGSRLQSQLNRLKHFENATSVSHILVGTYEMRPFRKVNTQLACRSVDVHFPRYDAAIDSDAQVFQSVVWALQRQLPIKKEPHPIGEEKQDNTVSIPDEEQAAGEVICNQQALWYTSGGLSARRFHKMSTFLHIVGSTAWLPARLEPSGLKV